ncbi:GNAT family N-acetyltransferase [Micromonospora humi]|uniref:Ribosomal-protein-alanine N-acetyltransferase n=1 Tax=Micromonospora humi TaxID=745366 RepID=A0A1C5JHR3_9ACTN|nr:GNAT family protein [Micromonospora humi]SCG70134.1 ribosomal-protein-alanine N-acetyltransferase [Micromonospora humi]
MTPIRSVRTVHLSGPRCALREWTDADAPVLHAFLTEPAVAEGLLDDETPTPEAVRAALPAWRKTAAGEPRPEYRLAAVDGDRLVGLGGLSVTSVEHRRGEIGYAVRTAHQGAGLGTEITRLLLDLAFEQVGLHRVEATTRPDNVASRRVLEKAGLRPEGVSRDHLRVRGVWRDSARYAILATDRFHGGD